MQESFNIPPALDRALALAILALARQEGAIEGDETTTGDAFGAAQTQLAAAVTPVVHALRDQGASTAEILEAIEDAFAALMAGRTDSGERDRMRGLGARAASLVLVPESTSSLG
jgi:hypothetical protein